MTDDPEILARENAALARLLAEGSEAGEARAYGEQADQVYEMYDGASATPERLRVEARQARAVDELGVDPVGTPTVVLVHGGYFRARTDRTHARPLARALAARVARVVLAEYRRIPGDPDASVADLRALDTHLRATLPAGPVTWVGHSAGGTFVLLRALDADLPPVDVVALAPLSNLTLDAQRSGPDSAVAEWIGGFPVDEPERYARVDPTLRLRSGAGPSGRLAVVHGVDDQVVTVEDSRRAAWPDDTTVRILSGAHHFDLVDPDSPHVAAVYAAVEGREVSGPRET